MAGHFPSLPPMPWRVPGSRCMNCAEPLAWYAGVGRLVLRHEATGSPMCAASEMAVHPADMEAAEALYREMDQRLANALDRAGR